MFATDDTRQEPSFASLPPSARARRRQAPPPRGPRSRAAVALAIALAIMLVAAAWVAIDRWRGAEAEGIAAASAPAAGVAQPQARVPAKEPVPELLAAAPDQLLGPHEVTGALTRLLGAQAVLKYVVTTDFLRKAVATLDNLGRDHAPAAAWPVHPAPGRFVVGGDGTAQVIAPENGMRYWALTGFIGSIDAAAAVDLYRRLYPALQATYRDLGFANRPLHARVLEVVDLLIATPEPPGPPRITLTDVRGPVPSTSHWTRYEYADPAFERLSSGQKILLRVGPDNRKVLRSKLEEIRRQLLLVSVPSRP